MKHCPNCDTDKPESEFYKNVRRPDGLSSYCRECALTKTKESQERIRARIGEEAWLERQRNATRRYRERNPEAVRNSQKAYNAAVARLRADNPDLFRDYYDEALEALKGA